MRHIQDLPPELFCKIIHNVVDDVGVRGAVRLFLVSKTFKSYIEEDIFRTKSMAAVQDANDVPDHLPVLPMFLHNRRNMQMFLFWRTIKPFDVNNDLILALKGSVEFLATYHRLCVPARTCDRDTVMKDICSLPTKQPPARVWAVLQTGFQGIPYRCGFPSAPRVAPTVKPLTTMQYAYVDYLCVAAYVGEHGAIEALLRHGGKLWWFGYAFGNCLTVAALDPRLQTTLPYLLQHRQLTDAVMDPKNEALPDIYAMFSDAFSFVLEAKKYVVYIQLVRWFATNVVTVPPKQMYNKWLADAIASKNTSAVDVMLDMKIKSYSKVTYDTFVHSLSYGTAPIVRLLVRKGRFNINRTYWGELPLTEAIKRGSGTTPNGIIRELLKLGADPDGSMEANTEKNMPLRAAVELGDTAIVQLLLDSGAKLNGYFNDNSTAKYLLKLTTLPALRSVMQTHMLRALEAEAQEFLLEARLSGIGFSLHINNMTTEHLLWLIDPSRSLTDLPGHLPTGPLPGPQSFDPTSLSFDMSLLGDSISPTPCGIRN